MKDDDLFSEQVQKQSKVVAFLKEGFHQKFKTSDKLQLCLYNQPFVLFFSKTVPNFSGSISGPELTYPEASTLPSMSQYFTIHSQYFTIRGQYFT